MSDDFGSLFTEEDKKDAKRETLKAERSSKKDFVHENASIGRNPILRQKSRVRCHLDPSRSEKKRETQDYVKENAKIVSRNPILRQKSRVRDHWSTKDGVEPVMKKKSRDYVRENAQIISRNPILRQKSRVADFWDPPRQKKVERPKTAPEQKHYRWGKLKGVVFEALGPYRRKIQQKCEKIRNEVKILAESKNIELEVAEDCKNKNTPLRLQGNMDFYTNDSILKRSQVRSDKETESVLEDWWRAIDGLKDDDGYLREKEFVDVAVKIQKALDKNYDRDKALEFAVNDWEHDSGGRGYIDKNTFFESVFEIADMWTSTTDTSEYVDMLRALLSAISVEIRRGRIRLRRTKDIRPIISSVGSDGRARWHVNGHGGEEYSRNALEWYGRKDPSTLGDPSAPSPDWVSRLSLSQRPTSIRTSSGTHERQLPRRLAPKSLIRIDSNVISDLPSHLTHYVAHPRDTYLERWLEKQRSAKNENIKSTNECRKGMRARSKTTGGDFDSNAEWTPWDLSCVDWAVKKDPEKMSGAKNVELAPGISQVSDATSTNFRKRSVSSPTTRGEFFPALSRTSIKSRGKNWEVRERRRKSSGKVFDIDDDDNICGDSEHASTNLSIPRPSTDDQSETAVLPQVKSKLRRLSQSAARKSAARRNKASNEVKSVLPRVDELTRNTGQMKNRKDSTSSSRVRLRRLSIEAAQRSGERRGRRDSSSLPGLAAFPTIKLRQDSMNAAKRSGARRRRSSCADERNNRRSGVKLAPLS